MVVWWCGVPKHICTPCVFTDGAVVVCSTSVLSVCTHSTVVVCSISVLCVHTHGAVVVCTTSVLSVCSHMVLYICTFCAGEGGENVQILGLLPNIPNHSVNPRPMMRWLSGQRQLLVLRTQVQATKGSHVVEEENWPFYKFSPAIYMSATVYMHRDTHKTINKCNEIVKFKRDGGCLSYDTQHCFLESIHAHMHHNMSINERMLSCPEPGRSYWSCE